MDPWILDINTWIIKAESHQHALGFREIHVGSEQVLGQTCCETRITESLAH